MFCSALFIFALFFGSLLFWKAPERVQIMKKVNRNNRAIDVTTVGGRIKKLRTDAGYTQEELDKLHKLIQSRIAEIYQRAGEYSLNLARITNKESCPHE